MMHYVKYDSTKMVYKVEYKVYLLYLQDYTKRIGSSRIEIEVHTRSFTRSYLGNIHSSIYIHTKEGDLRILRRVFPYPPHSPFDKIRPKQKAMTTHDGILLHLQF